MTDTKLSKGNRPDYVAFVSQLDENNKSQLVKVGGVWRNKKGTGFNLVLNTPTEVKNLFILPNSK